MQLFPRLYKGIEKNVPMFQEAKSFMSAWTGPSKAPLCSSGLPKGQGHLQFFLEWESPLTWRYYFLGCVKCSMYKDKGWHGGKEDCSSRCTLEQPLGFLGLLEFKQRCVYLDIIDSALIPGHNIGLKGNTWANLEDSVTIIRDKDIVWQISWTSESPALEPGPWRGSAFLNYYYYYDFAPQVCSYSHCRANSDLSCRHENDLGVPSAL